MENGDKKAAVTPRLNEGLRAVVAGALRVASYAYAGVPAEHWARIRQAIDNEQAALTVQVDIPSCVVTVMVDGQGWLAPQCLLRLEPPERTEFKFDA